MGLRYRPTLFPHVCPLTHTHGCQKTRLTALGLSAERICVKAGKSGLLEGWRYPLSILLTPTSVQQFLKYWHIRQSQLTWIGLSDHQREGSWQWVDDTPLKLR